MSTMANDVLASSLSRIGKVSHLSKFSELDGQRGCSHDYSRPNATSSTDSSKGRQTQIKWGRKEIERKDKNRKTVGKNGRCAV